MIERFKCHACCHSAIADDCNTTSVFGFLFGDGLVAIGFFGLYGEDLLPSDVFDIFDAVSIDLFFFNCLAACLLDMFVYCDVVGHSMIPSSESEPKRSVT